MTINDVTAYRIIKLMREKHITQYKLEKKSSITHGAMGRILSGKNKTINLATIYKLAKAFDMTIIEFLNDKKFLSQDIEFE